ncbi:hypothetical protein POM88_029434 [Heracleum sosnowskyi]|uniref:Peroxisomal membrane protein PEX14 n=1 Tax=Heracleum sosnowskyi TaxID=360622 RepID=A0AAD8HUQ8_9APIA|nr:hypothetical protein POM88_029434 [Heracleum sosnowskyi]
MKTNTSWTTKLLQDLHNLTHSKTCDLKLITQISLNRRESLFYLASQEEDFINIGSDSNNCSLYVPITSCQIVISGGCKTCFTEVKGSPVMYRRSFLEKKGLTKEEIDEAFRRVPDQTPPVSTGQPTGDGHLKDLGAIPICAGTALVFKNAIVPRLKSWIRKVVSEEEENLLEKINIEPSLAEEASVAAKAAAAAAADVARASQDMLTFKDGGSPLPDFMDNE